MENLVLMIGTSELLLIAALVLLLFGGKKLPEMMKGLGQGVKSFKDGMREVPESEASPSVSDSQQPTSEMKNSSEQSMSDGKQSER